MLDSRPGNAVDSDPARLEQACQELAVTSRIGGDGQIVEGLDAFLETKSIMVNLF